MKALNESFIVNCKARYNNIDFLRFLFSIIIVYYHIFHSNILSFSNSTNAAEFYNNLANGCADGYLIVECFFIIAGFFLFKTYENYKDLSFKNFIVKKIIRLWPVFAFSTLITIVASLLHFSNSNIYTQFINLFFLQCIGISIDYYGINWYISSFFWVMLFYFYILKNFKTKYSNPVMALCVYFSLVGNINHFNGDFGRETFNAFFNAGVMRALSGIGIGYFIGIFYDKTKTFIKENFDNTASFVVASFLEITCFWFLINHFLFNRINYENKLIFIIIFSILFFLFLIKKGILSKLLNCKYLGYLGKYSYSIYVMQQISFGILGLICWRHSLVISSPFLCIAISLIFCTAVGILTYYLIEKPSTKYLSKKLLNR